jgi:hypothetical protein
MSSIRTLREITEVPVIHNGEYTRIEIPSGTICTVVRRHEEGFGPGVKVTCTIEGIEYKNIKIFDDINGEKVYEIIDNSKPASKSGGRRKHRATKKARRHHRRYSRRNRA